MLPKTLKYGSKVESAYARSMRSNIQPQNGTGPYNLGDTIIINLPTRNNLVLVPSESYLKFNITVTNSSTDANAFRWDSCGAHGLIQRIRVFHGYGKYNLLCGTRNDLVGRVQTFTAATAATTDASASSLASVNASLKAAATAGFSVLQINSGDRIEGTTALVTAAGTTTNTYCLCIISIISRFAMFSKLYSII